MKRFRALFGAVAVVSLLVVAGCGGSKPAAPAPAPAASPAPAPAPAPAPVGETPKQLVIGFVPSQDAATIPEKVKPMEEALSKALGIPVKSFTGTNFAAVIEGMGSKQVDIGFLNTLSYVLAHDQYGVNVLFQTVRSGKDNYKAQFIAQTSKGYKSINDFKGKKFGFVDAASTSGYLYPALMFKKAGIDPNKDMTSSFLGGHDVVIKAVYNGDVEGGACFDDCRTLLEKTNPDVMQKVSIVGYSDEIPNDTVSVRKDLSADFIKKFSDAFLAYAASPEGKAVVKALYTIDGFSPSNDARFNIVRDVAKQMNIDLKQAVQGKK